MSSEVAQSNVLIDFLAWIEVNKKKLIIGAVALVAVGFMIGIYRWNARQQEQKASRALLDVNANASNSSSGASTKVEDYRAISKDYAGTRAGTQAALLAAGALFKSQNYEQSLKEFEAFLGRHERSPFAPQAAFGVAASLEALNRLDEAIQKYQNVVTRYPDASPANQAKLAMARLYEAKNQPDLALKIYEELTREKTQSQWTVEAKARRDLLQRQQTQSAVTNVVTVLPEKS